MGAIVLGHPLLRNKGRRVRPIMLYLFIFNEYLMNPLSGGIFHLKVYVQSQAAFHIPSHLLVGIR